VGGWGTAKRDFSYFSFTYEILGELEISLNIAIPVSCVEAERRPRASATFPKGRPKSLFFRN